MLSEFKTGVGSGFESCKELLLLLGLKVEEAGQGSITVSKDSRVGLLHCCTALAEAIVGEFKGDLNIVNESGKCKLYQRNY